MAQNTNPNRMREIEIFGIPALFSPDRIATEDVYPGLHHYELMSSPTFPDSPRHLTTDAGEKFLGTVLSLVKIHLTADGQREIEPGDLFLDIEAGSYTPAEFEEKYLSPGYGPQTDRHGKRS